MTWCEFLPTSKRQALLLAKLPLVIADGSCVVGRSLRCVRERRSICKALIMCVIIVAMPNFVDSLIEIICDSLIKWVSCSLVVIGPFNGFIWAEFGLNL